MPAGKIDTTNVPQHVVVEKPEDFVHYTDIRALRNMKLKAIALHLCIVDVQIIKTVQKKELLDQGWMKPDNTISCPNLMRTISHSNEVSVSNLWFLGIS